MIFGSDTQKGVFRRGAYMPPPMPAVRFKWPMLNRVNKNRLNNKIGSLRQSANNKQLDFIIISEAGLENRKEPQIKNFTAFRVDRKKSEGNR